jgi:hypothetical protein
VRSTFRFTGEKKMSTADRFQNFAVNLQAMQREAYALQLPTAAKMINDAMNKAGFEYAENIIKKAKEATFA